MLSSQSSKTSDTNDFVRLVQTIERNANVNKERTRTRALNSKEAVHPKTEPISPPNVCVQISVTAEVHTEPGSTTPPTRKSKDDTPRPEGKYAEAVVLCLNINNKTNKSRKRCSLLFSLRKGRKKARRNKLKIIRKNKAAKEFKMTDHHQRQTDQFFHQKWIMARPTLERQNAEAKAGLQMIGRCTRQLRKQTGDPKSASTFPPPLAATAGGKPQKVVTIRADQRRARSISTRARSDAKEMRTVTPNGPGLTSQHGTMEGTIPPRKYGERRVRCEYAEATNAPPRKYWERRNKSIYATVTETPPRTQREGRAESFCATATDMPPRKHCGGRAGSIHATATDTPPREYCERRATNVSITATRTPRGRSSSESAANLMRTRSASMSANPTFHCAEHLRDFGLIHQRYLNVHPEQRLDSQVKLCSRRELHLPKSKMKLVEAKFQPESCDALIIKGSVEGTSLFIELDSGAAANVVSTDLYRRLQKIPGAICKTRLSKISKLYDVQGNHLQTEFAPCTIQLTIGSDSRLIDAYVADLKNDLLLLGRPGLAKFNIILDFSGHIATVLLNAVPFMQPLSASRKIVERRPTTQARSGVNCCTKQTELKLLTKGDKPQNVTISKDHPLGSGWNKVPIQCRTNGTHFIGQVPGKRTSFSTGKSQSERQSTDNVRSKDTVSSEGARLSVHSLNEQILTVTRGKGYALLYNHAEPVTLVKGTTVGHIGKIDKGDVFVSSTQARKKVDGGLIEISDEEEVELDFEDEDGISQPSLPLNPEHNSNWQDMMRTNQVAPPEHLERIIKIFEKYPETISTSPYDFGTLKGRHHFKVDLELDTDVPLAQKAHRLCPLRAGQLKRAVADLVEYGILEESDSAYAMPIFLVKKRGGDMRLVYDARLLNSHSLTPAYPLPVMADIFTAIGDVRPQLFSLIDLKSSFFSIELSDSAKRKAAVITPSGLYCFKRLPFGLKVAPAIYQRLMNKLLSDLPPALQKYFAIYMDDIACFSPTISEHFEHIELVLKMLSESGLKIQPWKLSLCQAKIELLGRECDALGTRPLERNVQTVNELERPKTKKQAQQFNGMVQWLSPYVYRHACTMAPLTELTKGSDKIIWGLKEEEAFQQIKSDIARRTKVYFIDPKLPLYATTDASGTAIASYLSQQRIYSKKQLLAWANTLKEDEPITTFPPSEWDNSRLLVPYGGKSVPEPFALGAPALDPSTIEYYDPRTGETETGGQILISPVAFHSQKLTEVQQRWTIFELESLAFVTLFSKFEHLVRSVPLVAVSSDSSTWLWLLKCSKGSVRNTKLARYATYLYSFHTRVIVGHVTGCMNKVSDFLSRPHEAWTIRSRTSTKAELLPSYFEIGTVLRRSDILKAVELQEADEKKAKENEKDPENEITVSPQLSNTLDKKESSTEDTRRPNHEKAESLETNRHDDIHTCLETPDETKRAMSETMCKNDSQSHEAFHISPDINVLTTKDISSETIKSVGMRTETDDMLRPSAQAMELYWNHHGRPSESHVIKWLGSVQDKELRKQLTLSRIASSQRQDPWWGKVIEHLNQGGTNHRFSVIKGVLHKLEADGPARIVIPGSLLGTLICYFHVDTHQGATAIFNQIRDTYYAEHLYDKINNFCRSCYLCQICKYSNSPPPEVLAHSMDAVERNEGWSMDIVCSFKPSLPITSGSLLVCVEYVTGFAILTALREPKATEIAQVIEEKIITVFGAPRQLMSDGGMNLLRSKELQSLCTNFGIRTHISSPHASRCHGKVERLNAIVTTCIRIFALQLKKPWYKVVPYTQLVVNSRASSIVENHSPMWAMLGLRPGRKLAERQLHTSDVMDKYDVDKFWDNHVDTVNQMVTRVATERARLNAKIPGTKTNYRGKFVFAKDFTPELNKKGRQIYLSTPEKVIKDWGVSVLTTTGDGRTFFRHKMNLKFAHERDVELYAKLPDAIKAKIGSELTYQQLQDTEIEERDRQEAEDLERQELRAEERQQPRTPHQIHKERNWRRQRKLEKQAGFMRAKVSAGHRTRQQHRDHLEASAAGVNTTHDIQPDKPNSNSSDEDEPWASTQHNEPNKRSGNEKRLKGSKRVTFKI